jgi:hypothetical protein
VIGATGRVGSEIVRGVLARGNTVTAPGGRVPSRVPRGIRLTPAARHLLAGHITLTSGMKLILMTDIVGFVDDVIPAGDVDVGDVIVLPDADDPVLVNRVRLGQGGLIFTIASASAASTGEEERPVRLSASVRLRKRGRDMAG